MSAAVVAIVLFVFFLIGLGAGVLLVIALSARRADKEKALNGPLSR
jgi:F0F1-type ATP synthase assembly protein I